MTVKDFIWEYRFILLICMAIFFYALAEWRQFKTICYGLMLQAKRLAKDKILKSGDEQVEWIIKKAYQFLPKTWMFFISEELLRKIIRYLYSELKDYIDDGKINNSNH